MQSRPRGTRDAAYCRILESETGGLLLSISALPVFYSPGHVAKSHEELRWEDLLEGWRAQDQHWPPSGPQVVPVGPLSGPLGGPSGPSASVGWTNPNPNSSATDATTAVLPQFCGVIPRATPNLTLMSPAALGAAGGAAAGISTHGSLAAGAFTAGSGAAGSPSRLLLPAAGGWSATVAVTATEDGTRAILYGKTYDPESPFDAPKYLVSISAMQRFTTAFVLSSTSAHRSHEELRWEDYRAGIRSNSSSRGWDTSGAASANGQAPHPALPAIQPPLGCFWPSLPSSSAAPASTSTPPSPALVSPSSALPPAHNTGLGDDEYITSISALMLQDLNFVKSHEEIRWDDRIAGITRTLSRRRVQIAPRHQPVTLRPSAAGSTASSGGPAAAAAAGPANDN
ncbi:hypothetical protein VaNZ11_002697, partial [Volvox africanus]